MRYGDLKEYCSELCDYKDNKFDMAKVVLNTTQEGHSIYCLSYV